MEIKIDEKALHEAMNSATTKAVADALGGYAVREAVAKVVTEEVATGAIAQAIRAAVAQMDTKTLTATLATEMQRAVTRAVVEIVGEGLMESVYRLRGLNDYTSEDKAKREQIRQRILHGVEAGAP